MLLRSLNVFFHITHVLIISFILFGWMFERLRKLHLLVLILTIVSWCGLGFFFGWGYCFWTDWHWQVRDRLGLPHPASYIKLLADSITSANWDAATIDTVTVVMFTFVLGISIFRIVKR